MLTWMIAALCLQGLEGAPPAISPLISVKGKWVLDPDGNAIPPGSFTRGLQPSGLLFREGVLWSVGDQRSEYPGHLFRIDPATCRLTGKPILLEAIPGKDGAAAIEEYRRIPNSDFEGIALHPARGGTLFAVTEDKTPWVAEIVLAGTAAAPTARIQALTPVTFPPGITPWRDNPNFRLEGCTVSDDCRTLYLAYERARDDLPRIFSIPLTPADSSRAASLEEVPLPFASVPPRRGKERARLNINDIHFYRDGGRPALIALARDQERILLLDLERKAVTKVLDLELLDPAGGAIEWVSPEGLAVDPAAGRLWIINDPDSVERNYRARSEPAPTGRFAEYAPLLFEIPLGRVVGKD